MRTRRAGRSRQHHGAHSRRIRHGQGVDRPLDSLQLPSGQETICQSQLRRAAGLADRIGAVWPRARGVTDAVSARKGRFELAEGGTLFLDEIGDINPSVQVKLLRVLQAARNSNGSGGTETIRSNVRIVAATNKDLEQAVAQAPSARISYYRLNAFTIRVPPLRERKTDLPLLVDHFLEKLSRHGRQTVRRVSPPAVTALMSYHWPGNVRELENVLERATIVCDGEVLLAHHLPPSVQTAETSGEIAHQSLREATDAYQRGLLENAIKTARGNRAKAARRQ